MENVISNSIILLAIFLFGLILGVILSYYILKGSMKGKLEKWKTEKEKEIRKDALDRSRSALKGKVGEQFAPLMPAFNYEPSDARFIGSPVDYVIFEGHKEENPERITFLDVKTGEYANLTPLQKKFREIVRNGEVNWETLHVETD